MPSNAEREAWDRNLAAYKAANPGATAQDYANAIQDGRDAQSLSLENAQYEEQTALSESSLQLARDQFDYQKDKDSVRLQNITDSMASIKDIFGGRQPTYDALQGESFKLNERRLGDLQDDASRDLNFSLARAGTTGGSVEVDKNRDLAERMALGTGRAEIFAQGQADALKAQDDDLKSSLQGLAASGAVGGAAMANTARGSTQGRLGNAQYTPNIEGTFSGLSSNIGGARQRNTQGGF